ncbi:MAG: DUF6263 family protein [Ignavibacteria bacterium]|nr:DUF6263 family protein [Ignavibacteria bacterium]
MKSKIVFSFFISLLTLSLCLAQESFKLEYKYEKGKVYRYHSKTTVNIVQEMMGREMKTQTTSDIISRYVVENVTPEGNIVLVTSADSAVVSNKSQMMDTTMNMVNMIGKRTKITLSKFGETLNREVLDSVKIEGRMRLGIQDRSSFKKFPAHEIKIGDVWNATNIDTSKSEEMELVITSDVEYKLAGKEEKLNHNCLRIDYTANTSYNGKMKMMGMEMYMEGDGKVKGAYFFDPNLGLIIHDESDAEIESTIAITGQQNMTIPMSQSTKTVQTLLEN